MTPIVALRLGRVSNLPTIWTNVLAGCTLAGAAVTGDDNGPVAGLLLAMSLAYVGGMYLNDAFDREIDARERPERPIPAGEVTATTVFIAGFGMLGLSIAVVAWQADCIGPSAAPAVYAALGLAATIVVYDMFHKQNPLSPLLMGLCRALVYATAALLIAGNLELPVLLGAVALLAYLFGLTFAAKQENLATFSGGWPLALLAAPLALCVMRGTPVGLGLGALLAIWTVRCVGYLRVPERRNVPKAITGLIAGIALLDAMLVGGQTPLLALPCVAAFGLTLLLQRYVPGT